jgi:hypothetical protein
MTDTTAPGQKTGIRITGAFHRLLAFSGLIALIVVFSLASPNFMRPRSTAFSPSPRRSSSSPAALIFPSVRS